MAPCSYYYYFRCEYGCVNDRSCGRVGVASVVVASVVVASVVVASVVVASVVVASVVVASVGVASVGAASVGAASVGFKSAWLCVNNDYITYDYVPASCSIGGIACM